MTEHFIRLHLQQLKDALTRAEFARNQVERGQHLSGKKLQPPARAYLQLLRKSEEAARNAYNVALAEVEDA